MVCDERNHRVQVFELSGKFVTKFGSKGSESGAFMNPVCTANIGDGRIVVCDTTMTSNSFLIMTSNSFYFVKLPTNSDQSVFFQVEFKFLYL